MKRARRPIIVSPLNWGLGHASRCIPMLRALLDAEFDPVLAGDGKSLELLALEFPSLRTYELPSYDIRYSHNPRYFNFKLMAQGPKVLRTMKREYDLIQEIADQEKAIGIISDNRFGVRSPKVPSIYITHQLSIKAGWMSPLATRWHERIISKFDQCWVCDNSGEDSLAGELSSHAGKLKKLKWIGPLSRFSERAEVEKDFDIAVIISGPEPSRSVFEKKVLAELKGIDQKVLLVRGLIEDTQTHESFQNITIYNYLLSDQLEALMKKSHLIVSRSGYSSIMDLNAFGAKVLLVPTPGQAEQEYLASYLEKKGVCFYVKENFFTADALKEAELYSGFKAKKTPKRESLTTLFGVFQQREVKSIQKIDTSVP